MPEVRVPPSPEDRGRECAARRNVRDLSAEPKEKRHADKDEHEHEDDDDDEDEQYHGHLDGGEDEDEDEDEDDEDKDEDAGESWRRSLQHWSRSCAPTLRELRFIPPTIPTEISSPLAVPLSDL